MNSLDKTKNDFENMLINRLGMLNGNLNQVLAEVQMGRLKNALSRSKETSRTLTPYRDSEVVDEASPRHVFRLVFQKFRETQPDNYKVSSPPGFFLSKSQLVNSSVGQSGIGHCYAQ